MALSVKELVALYLLEHPEDEQYLYEDVGIDGSPGPYTYMTPEFGRRYTTWMYNKGYIDHAEYEKALKLWSTADQSGAPPRP
jgi:hypothetical protein